MLSLNNVITEYYRPSQFIEEDWKPVRKPERFTGLENIISQSICQLYPGLCVPGAPLKILRIIWQDDIEVTPPQLLGSCGNLPNAIIGML